MTINREASSQCQSQQIPLPLPQPTTTTPHQQPNNNNNNTTATTPTPTSQQQTEPPNSHKLQQLNLQITQSQQPQLKLSIGQVRRAHPASGATWNVQVVRGKMTSRCLWHACRALILGMVLMILGAGMATIGYYAVPLSTEVRGNSTVPVKNISRGYHLNNLSYIGPIVMGFGGFIVVAACVMTFEARDSAAKVVPARFKMSTNSGGGGSGRANTRNSSAIRRAAGMPSSTGGVSQTGRWEHNLGVFRASPAGDKVPDRQALTAALIHFSRVMGTPGQSPQKLRRVSRSGSVPNLHGEYQSSSHLSIHSPKASSKSSSANATIAPGVSSCASSSSHHHHHNHRRSSRHSSLTQRATRDQTERFLRPGLLKYSRHALSVDESHPPPCLRPILSNNGSQTSIPGGYLSPTHELLRYGKRSDVAKRHVLARQKPIEKDDLHSPRVGYHGGRRRSSTASDASMGSRQGLRRGSAASRTPSMDSKCTHFSDGHSPDKGSGSSPRISRRVSTQLSTTPSVEKEFRSQLSICSEPVAPTKNLSCQSSIEPCVPEEGPEQEDGNKTQDKENPQANFEQPKDEFILKTRPDTLILDCNLNKDSNHPKYLSRTNSSASSQKSKAAKTAAMKSLDRTSEIYFISSASEGNADFDSIEVIDERRSNSFGQSSTNNSSSNKTNSNNSANLQRLETVIYNESGGLKEQKKNDSEENDDRETTTILTIQAEIENNNNSH